MYNDSAKNWYHLALFSNNAYFVRSYCVHVYIVHAFIIYSNSFLFKKNFSFSIIKHYDFRETFRNTKPLCGKRPSSKIILISNWLNTRLIHCFNKIASARAQLIAGIPGFSYLLPIIIPCFIVNTMFQTMYEALHYIVNVMYELRVTDRKPHSHNTA